MNFKKVIVLAASSLFPLFDQTMGALPPQKVLQELQQEISTIIEAAKTSVVTISTKSSQSYVISKDSGLLSLLSHDEEERTVCYKNVCTGLIYDKDGYVVTKVGCLNETDEITITLNDGRQYKPSIIGTDTETGLTLLKIPSENLSVSQLGNSDDIFVGSWVTIIGNSMGVTPSVSIGLVSGVHHSDLLQLTATVNPGNSGSPVFDINGKVIGILIAKVCVSENSINPENPDEGGLAIPINKVRTIVNQLIDSYNNQSGWLGIQLADDSTTQKIEVIDIIPNSPADKAGLKKGDVLTKYNYKSFIKADQLGELIQKTKPGTTIPISFIRGTVPLNVFVIIGWRQQYLNTLINYQQSNPKHTDDKIRNVSYNQNEIQNEIKRLEQRILQLKESMTQGVVK
jgi:S1-C subfamily serine protease